MEKVQKPSNSVCYAPLSEPFRINMITWLGSFMSVIRVQFMVAVNIPQSSVKHLGENN
jgi:hypothetical protein